MSAPVTTAAAGDAAPRADIVDCTLASGDAALLHADAAVVIVTLISCSCEFMARSGLARCRKFPSRCPRSSPRAPRVRDAPCSGRAPAS